jgi:endonuclease-3
MDKKDFILKKLNEFFPSPKMPLNYKNSYTLLIAVLLSAQTTDKTVNKVTPILFDKASSPKEMLNFSFEEIKTMINPCGLNNTKAKAILGLSKILLEKYDSQIPQTFEELESLPGVGHKTASVVMTTAFNKNAFPVDTHIMRCSKRWGLSKGTTPKKVETDLKKIFPKKLWGAIHLQIIYFARKFCPAKAHDIKKCPICSLLD